MRSFRITLEYDGTPFHGWQTQRERPTIQQTLEEAIRKVLGETVAVTGSGRTDRGAHAVAQTAHFSCESPLPMERIQAALNAVLPEEIAVTQIREASEGFHARFSARSKTYLYRILNRPVRAPLVRDRTHWVADPLDLERMRAGASHLIGEHDFRAFRKEGGETKGSRRRIIRLEVDRQGDEIRIQVEATGFLYTMVRSIVGCLIQVGLGRWEPDEIRRILESGERDRSGPNTAPAKGLFLLGVVYEEEP